MEILFNINKENGLAINIVIPKQVAKNYLIYLAQDYIAINNNNNSKEGDQNA